MLIETITSIFNVYLDPTSNAHMHPLILLLHVLDMNGFCAVPSLCKALIHADSAWVVLQPHFETLHKCTAYVKSFRQHLGVWLLMPEHSCRGSLGLGSTGAQFVGGLSAS